MDWSLEGDASQRGTKGREERGGRRREKGEENGRLKNGMELRKAGRWISRIAVLPTWELCVMPELLGASQIGILCEDILPTSLTARTAANRVQACRVGLPVSPWTRAGLHDWWSAASHWTSRSTTPTVIIDLGTGWLYGPRICVRTIGDRAFPIAAARTWNSLPPEVTSSRTLSSFKNPN